MDSIPTPEKLNAFLDDIVHAAGTIRGHYRTAEPNTFSRPKHGSLAEKLSTGSASDLADLVGMMDRYRRLVRHAAREVVDARNRLYGAVSDLNDALRLLDPPPMPEETVERLLPHPADRGDVRRAKEAQKKRLQRAQRTGDWDEVGW